MALDIKPVLSRSDLRRFVYLPRELHAGQANWVPPLYSDEFRIFSPRRNLSHQYCSSIYALAWLDGMPVGRIAGIINHRYNEYQGCRVARFGYLEAIDSVEVTSALLDFVIAWARGKGMDKLVGPMGFTEEDPEGMLIEGFSEVPNLATYQNHAYLPRHMESLGYAKEVDYVVYKVRLANAISDRFERLYQRVLRNSGVIIKDFATRAALEPFILPVFRLMNESFAGIYGYSPLTEPEMRQLAKRYWPLLDRRFIKIAVDHQDKVVGFILAIPSLAEGLIRSKGKLFPTGIFHILRARKHSRKLNTYLGAVKTEYHGRGVDTLLGYNIIKTALEAGFEYLDGHHQLELNYRIRADMENVGGVVSKRYRIYYRMLQ